MKIRIPHVIFICLVFLISCNDKGISSGISDKDIKNNIEESKRLVVARVNGAEITMHSLIREMNLIAPEYLKGNKPSPELTERIKEHALQRLITKELFIQDARRQNIKIPEERIDAVIDNIKKLYVSKEAYENYLKERGLNEKELRREIERSHLFELYTARFVYERIRPDEKAIEERYKTMKKEFRGSGKFPNLQEARPYIERLIKTEEGEKIIRQIDESLRSKAKIEILLPLKG